MEKQQLTIIQESVYEYIKEFLIENHCPPTYKEIAIDMGWESPNTAFDHVKALCRKGWLIKHGDGSGKYWLAGIDIKLEASE